MRSYLTDMETRLRNAGIFPTTTQPGELDPELEGWLNWTQIFYTTLYSGMTTWVEEDNTTSWATDSEESSFDVAWYTTDFLYAISDHYYDHLYGVYDSAYKAYNTFGKWQKFYYAFENEDVTLTLDLEIEMTIADVTTNLIIGATLAIVVVGIGLTLAGIIIGNSTYVKAGLIVLQAAALVALLSRIMIYVWQISIAVRAGVTTFSGLTNIAALSRTATSTMVTSLITALTITWGFFAYQILYGPIRVGSLEFNLALAQAIANTIVALIFFALAFIPVVGPLISILLSITDVILYWVGVKGFSQWVAEKLADALFDVENVFTNADNPERLDISIAAVSLQDSVGGFALSNAISYTVKISNTLEVKGSFDPVAARHATFRYFLQTSETDQHSGLHADDMRDEWVFLGNRAFAVYPTISSPFIPFSELGTGLNRSLNNHLYLTESFVLPYAGCWELGGQHVSCDFYYTKDSGHINLGEYIAYDILPDTIGQFVSLNWNKNQDLPFFEQTDKDGDGLLSIDMGGTDPNDESYDNDSDGLSDYYEQIHGLNPSLADTDGDGLTDKEELFYDTSPTKADSDSDNLNDYVEVKEGWLVVYGKAANGSSLYTRVWSNPFAPNSDTDSLGDFEEFVFSTNPNAATDESFINHIIQVKGLQVEEVGAPELLLSFDDLSGASSFVDSSGNGHTASCASCPGVVTAGRYGQALSFDGVNDYVTVPYVLNPGQTNFTAAAWVNISSHTIQGNILQQADDNGFGRTWLAVRTSGQLFSFLGNTYLTTSQTLSLNQWHHVVVSYDGTNVNLYIDGSLATSAARTLELSEGVLYLGIHKDLASNWFNGMMDEVAIFDYALTSSEIGDLMNGQYNVNDQYLSPGAELTYEATISNTLLSQGANGFMVADTQQISPTIPVPDAVLHLDSDERVKSFLSVMGNSDTFYCIDNGTCPTNVSGGSYNRAIQFDGVDDIAYLPTMNVREEQGISDFWDDFALSFWLYVEELPPAGESIPIFTTDLNVPGALNVTVNSDGWILFDIQGTILKYVNVCGAAYGDCAAMSNYYQAHLNEHIAHGMPTYEGGQNLNTWVHYVFIYQQGINNSTYNWTHIYADYGLIGSQLSLLGYKYFGAGNDGLRMGPGTIGNSQDSQTVPLTGRLDEIAIYNGYSLFHGDESAIQDLYDGNVYTQGVSPNFWLRFLTSEVGIAYQDAVRKATSSHCSSSTKCPAADAGGQFNGAINFDGSDDAISLGSMDFAKGDYTISAWFKTSYSGNQYFLAGHDPANANYPSIAVGLDVQGHVYADHDFPNTGSNSIVVGSPAGYNDGVWHHVAVVHQSSTSYLYLDSVQVGTDTGDTYAEGPLNVVLGYAIDPSLLQYQGKLDELLIIPAALSADAVASLMYSRWPAIDIPDNFIPYHLDAQQELTINGTAQVDNTTLSTLHIFNQEVETAIEFSQPIQIPIVDANVANMGIYAPFEDVPGSTIFENIVDTNEYTCPIISACPTAGLSGIVDRAAYFDGLDDYLLTAAGQMVSFSVWVKADRGVIFDTRKNYPYSGVELDFGQVRIQSGGNGSDPATNSVVLPLDLPENVWTHVAITIDKTINLARVYVNGTEVGTLSYSGTDPYTGRPTLGANPKGGGYLNGYLDDFRAYSSVIPAGDIQTLYQDSPPIMRFEFDENEEATFFSDNSLNGFIGNPYRSTYYDTTLGQTVTRLNPAPGTEGKIGRTGFFAGQGFGSLTVTPTDDSALDLDDLTITGWVMPYGAGGPGVGQVLMAKVGNPGPGLQYNYELMFIPQTLRLTFIAQLPDCSTFITPLQSNTPLPANQWTHVALTFDGNTAKLYLNGQLDTTQNYSNINLCHNNQKITIGANLEGQMDELALYGRALSASELFSIYQRELRWYRTIATTYLTVDADSPTIQLLSTNPYQANGYIQLAVATQDPTSRVVLLEMGLKEPESSTFSWSSVYECSDSATAGVAWCPTFDSSALAGAGVYQVQFRAVDVVGNETFSTISEIYVDGAAPTVASNYNGTWIAATDVTTETLSWTLPLNGTISDPNITTGVAGSGVLTTSVMVSLYDDSDTLLGSTSQLATVSGNSWSIAYRVVGEKAQGNYRVVVAAEDGVGNWASTDVGPITLDERSVSLDTYSHIFTDTTIISQTFTFTGTASEQAAWANELARYHFENDLNDYGLYGNQATCSNCPAGITGLFGQALSFDGVNDTISTPFLFDPTSGPFSLALWFWADASGSGDRVLVRQLNGTGTGRTLLYIRNGNVLRTNLGFGSGGFVTGATIISTNQWHHAALTYDGAIARLYLDGQLDGSGPVTAEMATGGLLLGGNSSSNFFPGLLDEFVVYDQILSDREVYALAQMDASGVQIVEVGLEVFDFAAASGLSNILGPESIAWQPAVMANPNTALSEWAYDLDPAGLEDFYQVYLRGQDLYANESNLNVVWRGILDNIPPRIPTFTAQHLGGGSAAQTEYTFMINDRFLDTDSLLVPCDPSTFDYSTYEADTTRVDGITATCRIPGHQIGTVDLTACDLAGQCTTQSVTLPIPVEISSVAILTPTHNTHFTDAFSGIPVGGGAYDSDGIAQIGVQINGVSFDTLALGVGITDTVWAVADWDPIQTGTYTLTAIMTDTLGLVQVDSINVYVTASKCFVEYDGDGVVDFVSSDMQALQDAVTVATAGSTIRVGGTCSSTQTTAGENQTVYINKSLTIEGGYNPAGDWLTAQPTLYPTTLNALGSGRVIYITNGNNVTLRHLTLMGGNSSDSGGGIYQQGGTLQLDSVTVFANVAAIAGGGIYINSGTLTLNNSQLLTNTAGEDGGGIYSNSGVTLNIIGSSISDNAASTINGHFGGGIAFGQNILIVDSVLNGNRAHKSGAIYAVGTDNLTITNSTISGNTSPLVPAVFATINTSLAFTHVTIASNSNKGVALISSGSFLVRSSMIANNGTGNCVGTFPTDGGYNLDSDGSCGLTAGTSLPNTNPMLDPLADNGGPTLTHLPQTGSPVLNRVPSGVNGCNTTITTDQRGELRNDGSCDIGAVELQNNPTAITLQTFTAQTRLSFGLWLLWISLMLVTIGAWQLQTGRRNWL